MSGHIKIGFVFIIEHGDLENKGLLLAKSLRRFFNTSEECPIFAVQPRKGKIIRESTIKQLRELNVDYIYKPINVKWKNLPFANQAYGCSIIEEKVKDTIQTLVYLDADIICLGYPYNLFLDENEDVAVSPVDLVSSSTIRVGEELDDYWKFVYGLNKVKKEQLWSVKTKLGSVEIYPTFNSGVIAVKPELGVFERWKNMFEISFNKGYFGLFSPLSKEFFFTDQTFLSSLIIAMFDRKRIRILSDEYNFPINVEYLNGKGIVKMSDIKLLHYHSWMYNFNWTKFFEIDNDFKQWLIPMLPLAREHHSRHLVFLEVASQLLKHYLWKIKLKFAVK